MSSKEILVSIALGSEDIRIGKLWFHVRGHKESASFEYDKKWLDHPEKFALEPALKLTEGAFHTGQGINLDRHSVELAQKLLFSIKMAALPLLNFQKKMMSLMLLFGKQ